MTIPTLRISKHFSFILLIPAFCLNSLICAGQIHLVASDNPLRSRLDSLVDKSVQRYFQDKRAVGLSIALVQHGKPYFYNYGETKAGSLYLKN